MTTTFTAHDVAPPGPAPFADMVWIPGKTFEMGSDQHYPEERPVHRVAVDGFWIDRFPVTNRRFAAFVQDTGHVTLAERVPDAADYPGALPEMLYRASLVFVPPPGPVDLRTPTWWRFERDTNWRCPRGPENSFVADARHPVVHVAFSDAEAFAAWDGKSLPTEAEWELAARGGIEGAPFAWGHEFRAGERHHANTWQGEFPWRNLASDGYRWTSPVDAFAPNGYGVSDMIGNTWEWTTDWYQPRHPDAAEKACCIPRNPRGGSEAASRDPRQPAINIPRRVLKGGSHLCAPDYCRRYRPAARFPQPVDTSTSHVGFRCVLRPRL